MKLVLRVKDMDAAFARVRDRVAAIYTEGGAPIRPEGPAAVNRAVIMRDPDGYPLEFAFQGGPVSADVPASSIVIGGWATFIVSDVATTLGFYRDRLGFQPTGAPSTLAPAVLSLQGTPTATGSMSAGVKPPGGCSDLAHVRLQKRGACAACRPAAGSRNTRGVVPRGERPGRCSRTSRSRE